MAISCLGHGSLTFQLRRNLPVRVEIEHVPILDDLHARSQELADVLSCLCFGL